MENIPKAVKILYKELPKFTNGRINYKNASKAAVLTCFVKYKNKILLLKRSKKVGTYKELWNTVTGYLDELKPITEKVEEELREELSIKIMDSKNIKYGTPFKFTDKDIDKTWIIHPILIRLNEKPSLKLNWEHTEYIWIEPQKIANYKIVPKLDKTLKKVISY